MGKYNQLENMMLDIMDYGEEAVYIDIELISNAFERFKERDLYFQALRKLNKKLEEEL